MEDDVDVDDVAEDDVEIYEVQDGRGRPGFNYKSECIALLSSDGPLPNIGDVLILPRKDTNDTKEQAYIYSGSSTPFRVVDREHMYMRITDNVSGQDPVTYAKTWIHVRRIPQEEYAQTPGQAAKR